MLRKSLSTLAFVLAAGIASQAKAGPLPDHMIVCDANPRYQIAVWYTWTGASYLHGSGSRNYYYYPYWTPQHHGGYPVYLTPLQYAQACPRRMLRPRPLYNNPVTTFDGAVGTGASGSTTSPYYSRTR